MAGILGLIQQFKNMQREPDEYALAQERAALTGKGLQQQLQQGEESFAINKEIAKQNLANNQFNLQRLQANAPQQDFQNLVGTYGGARGGEAFIQQQPDLAQQLFSQGADQGPPDIRGNAQAAGNQLYNLGPETARKIRGESEVAANLLPLQTALQQSAGEVQKGVEAAGVPGRVQIAQAGQGATAAEHAKTMQAQASGTAFQNFLTNPAIAQGLPVLESTAATVKDENGARTLISQIAGLKAQVAQAASSSVAVGTQMGADAGLAPKLQALANEAQTRLDNIHRTLYEKYWGKKAQESKTSIDPFKFGTTAPENTTGYSP